MCYMMFAVMFDIVVKHTLVIRLFYIALVVINPTNMDTVRVSAPVAGLKANSKTDHNQTNLQLFKQTSVLRFLMKRQTRNYNIKVRWKIYNSKFN